MVLDGSAAGGSYLDISARYDRSALAGFVPRLATNALLHLTHSQLIYGHARTLRRTNIVSALGRHSCHSLNSITDPSTASRQSRHLARSLATLGTLPSN
ncbi:unnamed protein product [Colias eurytheme]|nr:unnamed protein product [Colias eurytheme]